MSAEIWIAAAAVFISGGAIGSAGTLLAQWLVRKINEPADRRMHGHEHDALYAEVKSLRRRVRHMDQRLDFTEQLLDGALTLAPPPRHPSDDDLEEEQEAAAEDIQP